MAEERAPRGVTAKTAQYAAAALFTAPSNRLTSDRLLAPD
jgi:hypothetical protein